MIIEIPYPSSQLSPNARYQGKSFWAKSKAKKDYADQCLWAAVGKRPFFRDGDIALKVVFYPPDRRKRDLDGSLSRIKAGIDALAKLWGIDDYRFCPITISRGEPVKGGKVTLEFKVPELL